ncbi:hypothetical protein [Paludibacterium denitrificans]|uniref:FMN-dependent NADH-azoreductase n=1 Tax=Paludibacterium denitrificans TaxID=2675226 RepID=A0A844GEE7_9NEIS|nr:hypothetical protein [Paludibacterium denitrificans]MTD33287.1 hypothetical protein [Paludibacterium denitrificans]
MKLLHLDSSILGQNSVSRLLTAALVEAVRQRHADVNVTYHDRPPSRSPTCPVKSLAPTSRRKPNGTTPSAVKAR